MTCTHCNHPLYAGIRCGVCGRWTDEKEEKMHTCSYECDRPECIKSQRDELRAKVEANTAEIRRYHKVCEMALKALEWHLERGAYGADLEGTTAMLREILNTKPAE